MDINMSTVMFFAFALLAVFPAFMVLFAKDIVRVAFWLLASLSGVAGLYIMMGADFLGLTQVLVYIGGILVLILFGIMMTSKDPLRERVRKVDRSVVTGIVTGATVFAALTAVILGIGFETAQGRNDGGATTTALGEVLLTDYVMPFEVVSVLLLFVLCGAAYVARRRKEDAHA
jgi:NADH-quinone oxidoreductase subunit J